MKTLSGTLCLFFYLSLFFFLISFTASYAVSDAEQIATKVINVIDGNTVEILTEDQETYKIMLSAADSPELGQLYGEEAKAFTEKLLLKKKVVVVMNGKDMWGNRLATITLKNGKRLDTELIKAGYAWHKSLKYKDEMLAELERLTKEEEKLDEESDQTNWSS